MAAWGRTRSKIVKTVLAGLLCSQGLFAGLSGIAKAADEPKVTLIGEEPVTAGATLKKYVWTSTRNKKKVTVNANVIAVDLTNPYVKLDVMYGAGNQFTKKQTVAGMAKESGAVAGINGDFFNTKAEGVPIGPQITDGKLLATPPYISGLYSFALTKDNKPVIDTFTFTGNITAADGASYPLGGINKTYYWLAGGKHSMADSLYMYTDAWGQINRANDGMTVPTEVLVQNDTVMQIADKSVIPMVPPKDGYILRASGKAAEFVRQHLKVGDPIAAHYEIVPTDPNKSYDVKNFKMMIGGHTILVDQGKPAAFSRDVSSLGGYVSRTGIGYSRDMKYAYLITVDNSGNSKGMSLKEFQTFMIKVGVWKGLNLDGGGSTTMVARPLGETGVKLANQTQYGTQRSVVNGLAVYSTAPRGEVKGFVIQGVPIVFLNEQTTFALKAYDEYYNPVDTANMPIQWSLSKPIGTFVEGKFVALQKGTSVITAVYGKAKQNFNIEVIGREQLAGLTIKAPQLMLSPGSSFKLQVVATTKKGQSRVVPPQSVQWEFVGFEGTMNGDTLTVDRLTGDEAGYIIARYDGYSTILTAPTGSVKMWADFDTKSYPVAFSGSPAETQGKVVVAAENPDVQPVNNVLSLSYDFTQGIGTKAAYADFGRVLIEGQPQGMKLKVFGDNSLNWLRAEFTDGKGALQRIDLAKAINWSGWKTVEVDLAALKLSYPLTLKRIYIANPEQGQDERAAAGTVMFDDIAFTYKGKLPVLPKNQMTLTVNQKTVTVNGKKATIEQAPVIVNGYTLVPIRFVVEAMGGEIKWNEKTRNVTIRRGGHLVDMWINQADVVVDGKTVTSGAAPTIMNNRTMVPLRLISENFGWKVLWDAKTRKITLQ